MRIERFRCGYPEGIESLMAGKIKYGQRFEDVSEQIKLLNKKQHDQLVLLVSCDRIYGFFEQRGGVANGPLLEQMVRDLLSSSRLCRGSSTSSGRVPAWRSILDSGYWIASSNTPRNDEKVSQKEARYYYDEMSEEGILDLVEGLGAKNVFCTVWNYINETLF